MSGFNKLTLASTRMLFRSPSTLRVAFVTPVVFAAVIALYDRLRFDTGATSIDFFDYITVGVAAWYITYAAQHGMTGAAASYRAEGVLKRIAVTPISSFKFISAQVLARVTLAVTQVVAVLAAGIGLGASIDLGANLAWVLVPVTMIVLMGLSIGFIWAGITRTPEGANTLDVMMAIPILFLAGAMWPRAAYPDALEQLIEYAIPFVAPFDILRGIALDRASITSYGPELLLGATWLVALAALATRVYRLEQD
ncbi:MAG: ABC transporter permease [Thermoleophilaceae bacterium]